LILGPGVKLGRPKKPLQRFPVEMEIDGQSYRGKYAVDGLLLRVKHGLVEKTTSLGSMPPEVLAKRLLREIVKGGPLK
jgi:hypothetical protein